MIESIGSLLPVALRDRLMVPEDLELEFKTAKRKLPSSLWETVSAFANTNGGWIILGVNDSQSPPEVVGVENPNEQLQDFYNQIRNPNKISFPVCGAEDASIEDIDGMAIIVIRVRAVARRDRPVHINNNSYQGTYVRRHAGDYHCTKPEVDRMMREASADAADSTVLAHLGWSDLDRDALEGYRRRFQTRDPGSPWNAYDDQRFLRAIGGYRRDSESGEEGITLAGLLLFGLPEAIREKRGRHLIDFRMMSDGDSVERRWSDRVAWEGHLLGAFEAIFPRLTADLPVPFELHLETRIDQSAVHIALREALVNLLVHADYAESQPSLVLQRAEGYLFRNPGNSRVPVSDLLTGDRSDPRNPDLVRMFRFIGLAEEAGTGMPKIIRAWRDLGLQLPDIDIGTERYEFSLVLNFAHLLSDDDRIWLRSLGQNWSEPEQLALVYAMHSEVIDNSSLRGLTGLHPTEATKVLGGLRDRGLLQMIGSGRSARYELGTAALNVARQSSLLDGLQSSQVKARSFDSKASSSDIKAPSFANVQPELERIAADALSAGEIDWRIGSETIIKLCGTCPLSVRELATFLSKSTPTVRSWVQALLANGKLYYLYPDRPTHPSQKYVASESIS